MATNTHEFLGCTIEPFERAPGEHRGRWIIRAYHGPTGMLYADEQSAHFATIEDAQEAIRIEESRRRYVRNVIDKRAIVAGWSSRGPAWRSEAGAVAGFAAGFDAAEAAYRPFLEALRDRFNVDDRLGGLGDWLEDLIGPRGA